MIASVIKMVQAGFLIAGYPIIIYVLLTYHAAWLGALLIFGMIGWRIHRLDGWLWWLAGLLAVVVISGKLIGIASILKLSPLLIHASLFYLFYQSLKDMPLIERFARLDFDDLPHGIAEYCRKLTILWSVFFALNIVACLGLALWGDDDVWAMYNGFVVYVLIISLMLGEYVWRHFAFPDLEIPPLWHSMRNIVKNGHKIWGREE